MERITAKDNEKIKYAVKLRENSSFRKKEERFFLEGARLCSDAADSGVKISTAFFTSDALEKYRSYTGVILEKAEKVFEITGEIASKLTDTGSSQGVFCICGMLHTDADNLKAGGKYLALENVQDPSNVGAVMRSAEAIGLSGVIVCGGCDIYNPKALRASMGSSLRLPVIYSGNSSDIISSAKDKGFSVYASVPSENAEDIRNLDKSGSVIIFVGNEGNGLCEETIRNCSGAVTIPMQGRAESFNASAAAAILAWELMR